MSSALAQNDEADKRRRGIRRTTLIVGLIALLFYIGFIVLTVVRGSK